MKTMENMQFSGQKCTDIIKYVYENYGEYAELSEQRIFFAKKCYMDVEFTLHYTFRFKNFKTNFIV